MRYLSVFSSDEDILKALSDIHLKGQWYDLDCTYSKGVFYKNIQEPKYKSDLFPINNNIIKDDSTLLYNWENNSINISSVNCNYINYVAMLKIFIYQNNNIGCN